MVHLVTRRLREAQPPAVRAVRSLGSFREKHGAKALPRLAGSSRCIPGGRIGGSSSGCSTKTLI
jgi:hypothetical protein